MISMEPVLKRGYTAWDQDVLPADEFAQRLQTVRASLKEEDLDALIIVNYSLLGAMFQYADIAYVGGLQSGGVLVVYHDAEPTLVTFGGGRELYFTREQTWIEHVVAGRGRAFETARELLGERGVKNARIGTTGLAGMPIEAAERFEQAFSGHELEAFDSRLAGMRLVKRPRELMAIGTAKCIVDEAAGAATDAFTNGASNAEALLVAERVARLRKARDVRVLASMNGKELRPFEGRLAERHHSLMLWVAAQYQGYWAETTITSAETAHTAAHDSVDAMAATIRPGIRSAAVADAGLRALPARQRDVVLQYGLGGTVGLAQCDGIEIKPGNDTLLPEGSVVSLLCCALADNAPSIASRLLTVTGEGAAEVVPVALHR